MPSVVPSGAARATRPVPRLPPAPATFSMTTGWPSTERIGSERMRAIVSDGPPAGNGAMMVTGRAGKDCAAAVPMLASNDARAAAIASFVMGARSKA